MKRVLVPAFTILLLGAQMPAHGAELIQMGHLESLATYTDIKNGDQDRGVDASGFYSPVVKFSESLCLIPLFDVHYSAFPQYLPQEEGNSFFNTYLVNNGHLALRKEFQPGWFFKVTALGTWSLMKETPNDTWGKGLYDYYDVGGNVELRRIIKDEAVEKSLSTAFQYYRRTYPNFQTLISSTSVTPPEVNEKDYDGLRYSARLENIYFGHGQLYLEPYIEGKFYVDKHLVAEDGTLSPDEMRFDYEAGISAGGMYVPQNFNRISLFMDTLYTFNNSNMDYYDSRNTIGLSDDMFTNDYYDYHSINITPAIEYAHPFGQDKAIRLRLSFNLLYRAYTDRKALLRSGDYTDRKQYDVEQSLSAALSIPVTKAIQWRNVYTLTHVVSNQKFEDYYRYNYDSQTVKSGLSWDF